MPPNNVANTAIKGFLGLIAISNTCASSNMRTLPTVPAFNTLNSCTLFNN